MADKLKPYGCRSFLTSFIMLMAVGCSGSTSTGSLSDGGGDSATSALDLAGSDGSGGNTDLGSLMCKGTETFQQARTAMLASCSGFAQFSCHTKSPFDGGLDLSKANAYKDLVNVQANIAPTKVRVKPSDPAASFLIQKLTNTQGATEGNPMPDPVEGLRWMPPDQANLDVLRCWIANGAKNN
jgi:hypothetical protein